MQHHTYQTNGTCSVQIDFDLDDQGRLHNVQYLGGCDGNLQGIGRLVEGLPAAEVRDRLAGIRCGWKDTSFRFSELQPVFEQDRAAKRDAGTDLRPQNEAGGGKRGRRPRAGAGGHGP